MANPLRIANKSKQIEEKTRLLFSDLKSRYDKGEIKTPTELSYLVYIALEDMFTQLGKPTMQNRQAMSTPISADYNNTIKEMLNDLRILFSECAAMTAALEESFQQVEIERQGLNWQVKALGDRLNGISIMMTQKQGEVVFRDSFLDATRFDTDIIKDDPAAVNTTEGVLSLMKIESEDYRNNVTVRILNGNGFLGNTHQVRSVSNQYKFYGEESINLDLLNIMDGNADTWIEYETYMLPTETENETLGYGFDYQEGIPWVMREQGILTLELEVELPVAKTINWFSLSPFIPTDKGSTPSYIRSVAIQDGKGSYNEVSDGYDILKEDLIYAFPRQLCKKVYIKLEQPSAYETLVGHVFYKELDSAENSYLEKDRTMDGRRVDGEKPSIELLGYLFDPATQSLIQPARTEGMDEDLDEDVIKAELFQLPEVTGQMQAGLEAVLASRFLIGLRDVTVSSYRFAQTSEYISTSYESENEIKSIELDVVQQIPEELGEGDWLTYQISIDEGRNWQTIHPRWSTDANAIVKYVINEGVPQEGRYDNYGYIDTKEPIHAVRFRIFLQRPIAITNADYYTPLVKEYKLHCGTVKGGSQ